MAAVPPCAANRKRLKHLQDSLDSLFETLKESGSKVGITSNISADLNVVSQEILKLMANFTFETNTAIAPSPNEMRRDPRSEHGLLVMVSEEGSKLQASGITADFSLSGLPLRMHAGAAVPAGAAWLLDIMTPCDSQAQYERQQPLQMRARVVWKRKEGDNTLYGLEFEHVAADHQARLELCARYFEKNPRFAAKECVAPAPSSFTRAKGAGAGRG